jgi:hypothetical protein
MDERLQSALLKVTILVFFAVDSVAGTPGRQASATNLLLLSLCDDTRFQWMLSVALSVAMLYCQPISASDGGSVTLILKYVRDTTSRYRACGILICLYYQGDVILTKYWWHGRVRLDVPLCALVANRRITLLTHGKHVIWHAADCTARVHGRLRGTASHALSRCLDACTASGEWRRCVLCRTTGHTDVCDTTLAVLDNPCLNARELWSRIAPQVVYIFAISTQCWHTLRST